MAITTVDFAAFTLRMHHLWGAEFSKEMARTWLEILGGLDINRLMATLDELVLTCKFPPKISEIVEAYEAIRERQAIANRASQIASHQRMLADSQHYCPICRNDGGLDIPHPRHPGTNYKCFVRCSCARGKDLSRWSRHQITKGMRWTNPATKEDESLYWPDVEDILTSEEIGLIRAKNMNRNAAIPEGVDVGIAVQGLMRELAV